MGRVVLFYSSHEKQSRDFIAANAQADAIDWHSGNPEVEMFIQAGVSPAAFPCVMDVDTKVCINNPISYTDAVAKIKGFSNVEQGIATCTATIDGNTKRMIEAGFTFQGMQFSCSATDQMNYTADMAVAATMSYPHSVKTAIGFVWNCPDQATYAAFYADFTAFVRAARQSGWALKDSLQNMTLDQLASFIDPRTL